MDGRGDIAAMEAKQFKDKRIFNPGNMSADELSQEFCGSCHRSAEEVISNKLLRGLIHRPFSNRIACSPAELTIRPTCVCLVQLVTIHTRIPQRDIASYDPEMLSLATSRLPA